MNLINIPIDNTDINTESVGITISDLTRAGVRFSLTGQIEFAHKAEDQLEGIRMAFPNHHIGHLAYRGQLLIHAAFCHRHGIATPITDAGKFLAGLAEEPTS